MDIKILDSWLREYLKTNATPKDIAKCVSLCGPSIERTHEVKINGKKDYVYDIEVTANRVDCMSVSGIAREASVILPEFGFKSEYITPKNSKGKLSSFSKLIKIEVDHKLTKRIMGVILEVPEIKESPIWMKERLSSNGIRSLNTAIDITNYLMIETGHPTHVFDFDLVSPKMIIRESKKGEKITTLDDKSYKLNGGDIVIDNGKGTIIDLPGIMGTKNSSVHKNTKRILFFLDSNDPVKIRKTSLSLGIRTMAAILNEKGVDEELAPVALYRGLELFKDLMNAKVLDGPFDLYKNNTASKKVIVSKKFIDTGLGIDLPMKKIELILTKLGFEVRIIKDNIQVSVPSFRAKDINIPEDILEEIARIYGYFKLPSVLMTGQLPFARTDTPFKFEMRTKRLLVSMNAHEVMTYSLVSKADVGSNSLKLSNPLGNDMAYLRNSLMPSLKSACKPNSKVKSSYHIFEISNVYLPKVGDLPTEETTLGGLFVNTEYRVAKGVIELLLNKLNVNYKFETVKMDGFKSNTILEIQTKNEKLGFFGITNEGYVYYEIQMKKLQKMSNPIKSYIPTPKYPPQIEDITFELNSNIVVGKVIDVIDSVSKEIVEIELGDIFESGVNRINYTFRINYQNPKKTLADSEVKIIRDKIIEKVQLEFEATVV